MNIKKDPNAKKLEVPFTPGQPVYCFADTTVTDESRPAMPALHKWHFVSWRFHPDPDKQTARIRDLSTGNEADVPLAEVCGSVLEALMTYVMQRMMQAARGEIGPNEGARKIIFACDIGLTNIKKAGKLDS